MQPNNGARFRRDDCSEWTRRAATAAFVVAIAAGSWATAASQAQQPAGAQAARQDASPTGFYTEEQAARGKPLFERNCGLCHSAGAPTQLQPATQGRGFWWGDQRLIRPLGGQYVRKYPSVYHFFRRVRDSMPPGNTDGVSVATKLDIVAYLLQANGIPPGRDVLTPDVRLMKTQTLNEPGFEPLFNGRDFTGIRFVRGMNCGKPPAAACSTEPGPTIGFQFEGAQIHWRNIRIKAD